MGCEFFGGKNEEACNVMFDALNEAEYKTNAAVMRTLGQIKFRFSCNGVYSHYRRMLHMDTGEAEVCYQLGKQENKRVCFVSRKRDIMVLKMTFAESTNFSLMPGFFNSYEGGSIKLQWNLEEKTYRAEINAIRDTDITVELPFGQGSQKLILPAGEKIIMCI